MTARKGMRGRMERQAKNAVFAGPYSGFAIFFDGG